MYDPVDCLWVANYKQRLQSLMQYNPNIGSFCNYLYFNAISHFLVNCLHLAGADRRLLLHSSMSIYCRALLRRDTVPAHQSHLMRFNKKFSNLRESKFFRTQNTAQISRHLLIQPVLLDRSFLARKAIRVSRGGRKRVMCVFASSCCWMVTTRNTLKI